MSRFEQTQGGGWHITPAPLLLRRPQLVSSCRSARHTPIPPATYNRVVYSHITAWRLHVHMARPRAEARSVDRLCALHVSRTVLDIVVHVRRVGRASVLDVHSEATNALAKAVCDAVGCHHRPMSTTANLRHGLGSMEKRHRPSGGVGRCLLVQRKTNSHGGALPQPLTRHGDRASVRFDNGRRDGQP